LTKGLGDFNINQAKPAANATPTTIPIKIPASNGLPLFFGADGLLPVALLIFSSFPI
jgi:hypothetical protein